MSWQCNTEHDFFRGQSGICKNRRITAVFIAVNDTAAKVAVNDTVDSESAWRCLLKLTAVWDGSQ